MSSNPETGEAHPIDVHVGKRLRELRKQKGISQSELGEALGISFQQVQKYERGANRVSASKLYEAAEAMGFSIVDFFAGLPHAQAALLGPDALQVHDPDFQRLASLYQRAKNEKARRKLVDAFELLAM